MKFEWNESKHLKALQCKEIVKRKCEASLNRKDSALDKNTLYR